MSAYKDLGLNIKGQNYRFVDANMNVDIDDIKDFESGGEFLTKEIKKNTEHQALSKKLADYEKNSYKNKVIKSNDILDREKRVKENSYAYDILSKDISKYNDAVKNINESDIVDFRINEKTIQTMNMRINNSKESQLEKQMKEILTNNNEKNLNKLIDPEILKKRYDEISRHRYLLYQQEIKNQHKNKIKSKLYHKIKKRQKLKNEENLLNQLAEVDPNAVKEYLKKKQGDRAEERIELKHTTNKFTQNVKRYNLIRDSDVRKSYLENMRLRNKLMEKVDVDDSENTENEENDENDISEDEEKRNEENDDKSFEEGGYDNENNLLLNFEKNSKKEKKQPSLYEKLTSIAKGEKSNQKEDKNFNDKVNDLSKKMSKLKENSKISEKLEKLEDSNINSITSRPQKLNIKNINRKASINSHKSNDSHKVIKEETKPDVRKEILNNNSEVKF